MITPPYDWTFRRVVWATLILIAVAVVVVLLTLLFLTREGRYLGPLFESMYRRTGWHWTEGRVARFIRDVEALFPWLDWAYAEIRAAAAA